MEPQPSALAVSGRVLVQWVPTLATLCGGRGCLPLSRRQRIAARGVKSWGIRHPGGTLAVAFDPHHPTLVRRGDLLR